MIDDLAFEDRPQLEAMTISFWTGFSESTLSKSPSTGSRQAGGEGGIDSKSRTGLTATSLVGVSLLGYGHLSEDMVDSLASVSERSPPRRKMRDGTQSCHPRWSNKANGTGEPRTVPVVLRMSNVWFSYLSTPPLPLLEVPLSWHFARFPFQENSYTALRLSG